MFDFFLDKNKTFFHNIPKIKIEKIIIVKK